jgi:hypothetical protein
MKPLFRLFLAPVVVLALAWAVSRWYIHREESPGSARSARLPTADDILARRVAAIESAKNRYQILLAEEKEAYALEKKEAQFPELAELSHEVRLMRINLEHQTALATIDEKYPPPNPPVVSPAAP